MDKIQLAVAIVGTLAAAACSGSSSAPTTPSTPTPPTLPAPTTYTISGTVTATNGGQPLSDVIVDLSGSSTATDGAGRYSLTLALSLTSPLKFQVSGAGFVTHSGLVRGGDTRNVDLDAIRLDGTFDRTFYDQFVHNALDDPTDGTSILRWTQAPKIYIRTIDDAGKAVEPRTLTATVNAFTNSVGMWTAGRFGFAAIEQGAADRTEVGWITVRWYTDTSGMYCGYASVAANPGSIALYYKKPNCSCAGVSQTRPLTVKHELGHALGYWHTDSSNDVMYGKPRNGCDQDPTPRERYHAAIAYSRPVGNYNPDNDPTDATYGRPLSSPRWIP